MSLLDTACGFWSETQPIMADAESEKTLLNTGKINCRQKGQIPDLELQHARVAECGGGFMILEN